MSTQDSSAEALMRVSAIMMAVVVLALILRVLARWKDRPEFAIDDWLIGIAALFFFPNVAVLLLGAGSFNPSLAIDEAVRSWR